MQNHYTGYGDKKQEENGLYTIFYEKKNVSP